MSHKVTIRDLQPTDAARLSELFVRCYGDTYGSEIFYDVGGLAELISQGALLSVVATDGSRLLGHTGIRVRHVGALVCETGNTVVDPAARGHGLLRRLGGALHERVVREGFIGYIHYPTTAHEIMQRASVAAGGHETGVMLAYVPAATEYKEVETRAGRIAVTVAYQPFAPSPRRDVALPARYRALIERLHADLALPRGALRAGRAAPARTKLSASDAARRQVLQIFVAETGEDLAARIAALIETHAPKLTHVDLPMDDAGLDRAVDALAEQGFFFCALLPEFAHTDVLRLQALHDAAPDDFAPALRNRDAQRLCASMRDEVGRARRVD